MVTGRAREPASFTREAIARAEAGGDPEGAALLQIWHGYARVMSGDAEGVSEIEEAAALLKERGHRHTGIAFHNLGETLVAMGYLRRASEARAEAVKWTDRLGANVEAFVQAGRAEMAYHAGDWQAALDIASPLAEAGADAATYARWTRGLITLARGDDAVAKDDAEVVLTYATSSGNDETLFQGLALQALAQPDAPEVSAICQRFLSRWREIGGLAHQALALAELAVVPSQDEVLSEAATLLPDASRWKPALLAIANQRYADAAQLYAEIGSLPLEAGAYMLAATNVAQAGRHEEAASYVERALAFYRRVGATAYARACEALLARAESA
jgi:tetratricopeptide (TPR) repeat protein